MLPNYQKSIVNVSNALLNHYGVKPFHTPLEVLKPYLKDKKHIMYILLDGMGMNILKNLSENTLLRQNVKMALTSVFPPTTVAATTSVLSGLTPYEHGHIGWTQYNRFEDCQTVIFQNLDFYDETHILKNEFAKTHLAYENILEKIAKKNPNLFVKKLFPDFEEHGYPSFEAMVDELISISKKESSFTYTYWNEPDYTIHSTGIHDGKVKLQLEYLTQQIERLYQQVTKDTLIILIADHGLVNVEGVELHHHPILELLDKMPSVEPRSTVFFVKKENQKAFEAMFNSDFGSKFTLLNKETLLASGRLGSGIKHPLLDDFIGDYIAISEGPFMFNMKENSPFKAHHAGGYPDELWVPLILLEK
ncbi:alkaline phosphatase family protein [Acholeplasma vituli]|uniref:Alkaline phosphatase family protein n=1 Tax=Paracholeplasma vituli TaxID=69473 RepID=A0ABT2PUK1_9MOLU|nr:alkaline phosphatase family protein [Paracholeplasma vituli]MCU0104625.1 alkaline phosphatase family protein [Paracholeplasma vituli]